MNRQVVNKYQISINKQYIQNIYNENMMKKNYGGQTVISDCIF